MSTTTSDDDVEENQFHIQNKSSGGFSRNSSVTSANINQQPVKGKRRKSKVCVHVITPRDKLLLLLLLTINLKLTEKFKLGSCRRLSR